MICDLVGIHGNHAGSNGEEYRSNRTPPLLLLLLLLLWLWLLLLPPKDDDDDDDAEENADLDLDEDENPADLVAVEEGSPILL